MKQVDGLKERAFCELIRHRPATITNIAVFTLLKILFPSQNQTA